MPHLLDRLKTALADRYALQEEIGGGGMANVYLAHDLKHDRKVAVKVLRPELAAVLGAERFVQEITTTANPEMGATFLCGETGILEPQVDQAATSSLSGDVHRCRRVHGPLDGNAFPSAGPDSQAKLETDVEYLHLLQ